MAKYVENFSIKNAPRALSPLTFIWVFIVPSSPTVPTHTFTLIATKLIEIRKNIVQHAKKEDDTFFQMAYLGFLFFEHNWRFFLNLNISFFSEKKV